MVSFDEPINQRIVLDTPEEIAEWTTDNEDNFHGTHVCNIMAGSYKANNLYGMAPGADIVMTSSLGYDVGLLAGCEEIVAYAKSVGKPAVINLSFSSYTGPRMVRRFSAVTLSRSARRRLSAWRPAMPEPRACHAR